VTTEKSLRRRLAKNLRAERTAFGLSQTQLEGQSGVDQAYISSIEHALINPTLATMLALANGLGVDVHDLMRPPTRRKRR
jgi:transcriptional regulator with XRE-family HTH domain